MLKTNVAQVARTWESCSKVAEHNVEIYDAQLSANENPK